MFGDTKMTHNKVSGIFLVHLVFDKLSHSKVSDLLHIG